MWFRKHADHQNTHFVSKRFIWETCASSDNRRKYAYSAWTRPKSVTSRNASNLSGCCCWWDDGVHVRRSWSVQTDEADGFRTRSILCMPIRDAKRQVIGVAQFVNKQDGTLFNKNDENLFEVWCWKYIRTFVWRAFSVAGPSLLNCLAVCLRDNVGKAKVLSESDNSWRRFCLLGSRYWCYSALEVSGQCGL